VSTCSTRVHSTLSVVTVPSLSLTLGDTDPPFLHKRTSPFVLVCQLKGGHLENVVWLKNGQKIVDESKITKFAHGQRSVRQVLYLSVRFTFTVSSADEATYHAGAYECSALTSIVTDEGATVRMQQRSNVVDLVEATTTPFMKRQYAARHWPNRIDAVQGQVGAAFCDSTRRQSTFRARTTY